MPRTPDGVALPSAGAPGDHPLRAAVQGAAQRGDLKSLRRLAGEVLAGARAARADDHSLAGAAQEVMRGLAAHRQFGAAVEFSRAVGDAFGFDRLASSEIQLLLAAGEVDEARAIAETMADAPVHPGGHGLRAFVRELLGRHTDAAADGAVFVDEAIAVHAAPDFAREVARRYTPAAVGLMRQYGAACAHLAASFPGSRPWRGEPLDGRTALLYLIEGLGDQLQGLRLASTLRDAGARVLVACDPTLADVVRASGLADEVIQRPFRAAGRRVDAFLVVGGRLHESGIPPDRWAAAPYLARPVTPAEPAALAGLGRPRVGIIWAGNPAFPLEAMRSLPYAAVRRLVVATPHVSWVSLQLASHPRAAELRQTPATRRVRDAGADIATFDDTAALMCGLDLVVCSDSAPVHLAGALGVPVWLLLGTSADWRWGIGRESTPLYPSVRLIRDGTGGDWNAAVDRVARDLAVSTSDERAGAGA